MNKYLHAISIALFALAAQADTPAPSTSEAKLEFRTHLGATGTHSLVIKNDRIYLDKRELPPELALAKGGTIASLLAPPPKAQASAPCTGGTYEHAVTLNKKVETEKGCVESERFAELSGAYEFLNAE